MSPRSVAALLAFALAASSPAVAQKHTTRKARALRSQLQSLGSRIRETRSELRQARRSEEAIAEDLDAIETRLRDTRRRLSDARDRLERTRAEQQRVRRALAESQAELEEQERRLADRLVANFRQGPVRYVSVLLGARTMGEFVGRAQFVRSVVRHDALLIARIAASREKVLTWKAQVDAKARQAVADARTLAGRQAEEAGVMQLRRDLLAEARQKRAEIEQLLADQEAGSREITRRLQEMERTPEGRARSRVRFSGGFVRPASGGIRSGYGMRFHPILKRSRMHTGVDIAGGQGDPIFAAASGVVVYAGRMSGYGNAVVVDHGGGVSTLYAHCSALLVRDGQSVSQGQTIARIGATGLATGPHLHFEVRRNGNPVDPGSL